MGPAGPNDRLPREQTAGMDLPAVSAGRPARPAAPGSGGAPPGGAVPRVEGYRILRPLGQGGMGAVWLAHEELLDRRVALKFVQGGGGDSPGGGGGAGGGADDGSRRFLREARAAAGLNHPNIATVYRFGTSAGRAFIAMEYVEAGCLADELKRHGPMPWPVATRAVRDAALALHAAHEAGLVHRDVKPSNLMRSARGLVKVVDFGLARPGGDNTSLTGQTGTAAGMLLGTPAYMSPEQCQGGPADARSDLYALTCTYYHLLTGRPPFAGDNPAAVLYQHCHQPFPDASRLVPGLPPQVLAILERGSRKDPARRYPSAVEMLADLRAVLKLPEAAKAAERDGSAKAAAAQAVPGQKAAPGGHAAAGGPPGSHDGAAAAPAAPQPLPGPPATQAPRPAWLSVLKTILKGRGIMGKLAYTLAAATLLGTVLYVGTRHSQSAPAGAGAANSGVPTAAQQEKAEATVRKVLAGDFADRTPAGRLALARKLLEQGRQTRDDRAMRYVCLRDARDLAAGAGEVPLAFEAADEMAAGFGTAAPEQKAAALAAALPQLPTPAAHAAAAEAALAALEQAVAADDLPAASRLASLLDTAATKSGQLPLVAKAQAKAKEVAALRQAYDRRRAAEATLKARPDDPEANAAVGRWLCLVKGEWDKGLPMLAKGPERGEDKALKDLAKREVAKPADAAAKVRLADGWWDAAERLPEAEKAAARAHAAALYAAVLPQAPAADRARAEARANGVAATSRAAPPSPSSAASLLPPDPALAALPKEPGLMRTLEGHTDRVWGVNFLPDGKRLISGSYDGATRLWDLASGQTLARFEDKGQPNCWSPDGRRLYCGAKIWDLDTGKPLAEAPRWTYWARFLPARRGLLLAVANGPVRAYDPDTGLPIRDVVAGPFKDPNSTHWGGASDDGRHFVVSVGGEVKVFDTEAWTVAAHVSPGAGGTPQQQGLMSPDGRVVLVYNDVEGDASAFLWDWKTDKRTTLFERKKSVSFCTFSADGNRLLTHTLSDGVQLWDATTGTLAHYLNDKNSSAGVNATLFSPDGRRVLIGHRNAVITLWDGDSGKRLQEFAGHTELVRALAFSPDGRLAASGADGKDSTIRLWRLPDPYPAASAAAALPLRPPDPALAALPKEPGLVRTLEGHSDHARLVRFLPGGRLVSAAWDGTVRVWDLTAGKELFRIDAVNRKQPCVAVEAQTILSNNAVWSLADGRKLASLPAENLDCIAATRDGRKFVLRGSDGALNIVDPVAGTRARIFPAAADVSGEFSRDGSYFLYTADGSLRVYATEGWKALATFGGAAHHFDRVGGTFSPDGGAVLVGNDVKEAASALVWDWRSGRETPLNAGKQHVRASAWSPDGSCVYVDDSGLSPFIEVAGSKVLAEAGRAVGSVAAAGFAGRDRGVCFGQDGRIALVDLRTKAVLWGATEKVGRSRVLFDVSPDGRFLATAVASEPGPAKATPVYVYRLPDPAPQAATAPAGQSAGAVDLLPLVRLDRNAFGGDWERTADGLDFDSGGHPLLDLPYQVPTEYDFTIDFSWKPKSDHVVQMMTHAGRQFAWVLHQSGTGGFEYVNGKSCTENETTNKNAVAQGDRHVSTVKVRRSSVTAEVDGKPVASLQADAGYSALSNNWWDSAVRPGCLAVGASGAIVLHRAQLVPVSGTGSARADGPLELLWPAHFTADRTFPDGWGASGQGAPAVTHDAREFKRGPESLRVSRATAPSPPQDGWIWHNLRVPAVGTLRVSGYVKASPDFKGEGDVVLQCNPKAGGGAVLWKACAEISGPTEWTRFSKDFPLPLPGDVSQLLVFFRGSAAGTLWLDDLHVTYLPPEEKAAGGELLKNGDFAAGKEKPDGWELTAFKGSIQVARDAHEARAGHAALCLTGSGGANGYLHQHVDLPKQGTIRVTGFAKTGAGFKGTTGVLLITDDGQGGNQQWVTVASPTNSHEWSAFSKDVPLPFADGRKAEIQLKVSGDGSFWVDDLRVTYIPPTASGPDRGQSGRPVH